MFETTGEDIIKLGDDDLRALVALLARTELGQTGHPISAVTAGGNQDAADGGLDVRVECDSDLTAADFVPRRLTGFQVKKPDMPRAAIFKEMRPKGRVREVIRQLADASGAYVIVSAKSSVADKPLADRRKAMRDALEGLPSAKKLRTDFYDRERLSTWVNKYPGAAAWVRSRVGRPLSGWSGIGDWGGGGNLRPKQYLSNDKACLIDESSQPLEHLTIADGITRLRHLLRSPKKCIRLVGLSGLGKTRLVQALFEEGLGETPLDPGLAIYTDYSEEPEPTARTMMLELIALRQRAILIVDNCNPATHAKLAELCQGEASEVSLISVEYDVHEDEPEHTQVFRLQAAAPELVTKWLEQSFSNISQIDCGKIAEFSNGNFRVARALADTLGKGETLGSLRNKELFERIFQQRHDPDKELLRAAEDISLLYSIEGENVSMEGELSLVGALRDVSAQVLYSALVEMKQRGVVQARGRYRAILPQAIANWLAAAALLRTPPACLDQFCETLPPRMIKSMSRRLGFLHDSTVAQAIVARWLRMDGVLGDLLVQGEHGFQVITNIAPVAPEAVLSRLEEEFLKSNGPITTLTVTNRQQWMRLIKVISYDAKLFDRAVALLARFLPADLNERNSALDAFGGLFHLHLSGTQAPPAQRRDVLRQFAASQDDGLRRSVNVALRGLLETHSFWSTDSCDFGARSRDWGWEPKLNKDVWDWFAEAIKLVLELTPEEEARALLAQSFRGLWRCPSCHGALEQAAVTFLRTRPWVDGWIACRSTHRFGGKDMPADSRERLERLINLLKPADLLNRARAIVLNGMLRTDVDDFADGESDDGEPIEAYRKAERMAKEVGVELAHDATTRVIFLPELLKNQRAPRAFECGCGLADGAESLATLWAELVVVYGSIEAQVRNATALGGFIERAHQLDERFALDELDASACNVALQPVLPYLQARIGLGIDGVNRLRRAIAQGGLVAGNFYCIANRTVSGTPPESLAALLEDISNLAGGVDVALDILHMRFPQEAAKEDTEQCARLISVGRELLIRVNFTQNDQHLDYRAHNVIQVCLAGEDGRATAKVVCELVRAALEKYRTSSHSMQHTLKALFEVQPFVALDTFLLSSEVPLKRNLSDEEHYIENLDSKLLQDWANIDPTSRYPILGKELLMFSLAGDEAKDLSPLFLSLLEQAPDKGRFLGDLFRRMRPLCWWRGSLEGTLTRRMDFVLKLAEHQNKQVRDVVNDALPELRRWVDREIQGERNRTRESEESFE